MRGINQPLKAIIPRQPPFVVFALPRSRTYWLSHWLSYVKDGKRQTSVGHDSFSRCAGIEQCLGLFQGPEALAGTIETGAAFAFETIRRKLPEAKMLVLQRRPEDSLRSLIQAGITPDPQDWRNRVADLFAISAQGVRTVWFEDLELESCARWLWSYCLGLPWDQVWWEHWRPLNIQVDMPRRIQELRERAEAVAQLKQEIQEEQHNG